MLPNKKFMKQNRKKILCDDAIGIYIYMLHESI